MPRRVKFIDRDRGWKRLVRRLQDAGRKPRVVIGIFGKKGDAQHAGARMSVSDLGTIHEFGLGNAPERSFIRATVDAQRAAIQTLIKKAALNAVDNRGELRRGLTLVGLAVKGMIQSRISAGIPPPNKPATIRQKGSSKPLIDQGQLRASIDYEVRGL